MPNPITSLLIINMLFWARKLKVKIFIVAALSTELCFYKRQSFLHHQGFGIQFLLHDQLYETQESRHIYPDSITKFGMGHSSISLSRYIFVNYQEWESSIHIIICKLKGEDQVTKVIFVINDFCSDFCQRQKFTSFLCCSV